MNLYQLLNRQAQSGKSLCVGLIGAGKFGSMFLAQAQRMPGMHLVAIADLAPRRAREALRRCGWPDEQFSAKSLAEASRRGTTFVADDAMALIAADGLEIVIDATGKLMPAGDSLALGGLPIGVAHGIKLKKPYVLAHPLLGTT